MEKIYQAAWGALQKLTFRRYQKIIKSFQTLENAWHSKDSNRFRYAGLEESFIEYFFSEKKTIIPEKEFEKLQKTQADIICFDDQEYPTLLKEISQPPVFLYIKGKLKDENKKNIAVIGTRNCSIYGKQTTQKFVRRLVENNLTITSGLALGIDGLAHQEALNANGKTIAVLPCGIDTIYPRSHQYLADKILQNNGAIISEFPPGLLAEKFHFPRRNRIVSGLSHGTLVIEAGEKSGACITSRLALEQNREVFAIPGSIHAPQSIGTNRLISKGEAKLVSSVEDILNELNFQGINSVENVSNPQKKKPEFQDLTEEKLYNLIKNGVCLIDDIVRGMEIPIITLNPTLTMMEMRGILKNMGNGHWVLNS